MIFPLSLNAGGSPIGSESRCGGSYFFKTLKMDFLLSVFNNLLMFSKVKILRIIFYLPDTVVLLQ